MLCDTFDDFGVKNDQKVSNNMILMSKYKGKHGGKKGQKIRAGVSRGDSPPPLFGQCPKENIFFQEGFPKADVKRDNDNNMGRFKSQGETLLF